MLRRLAARPALWLGFAFVALVFAMPYAGGLFHDWYPELQRPVYTRASFAALALSHIGLVALSSLIVAVVGIALGAFVTSSIGRDFAGIVDKVVAIGQTFPPAAVLAVAVPATGYGATPTLIALVAYGVLPVVETTIAGLKGVPAAVRESADGVGFTPLGRLGRIELPIAAPVILTGLRTSVVINIGTATIGSTVGALTLGSPIIEGLSGSNPAYVVQGAVLVALLAVFVDQVFEDLHRHAARHRAKT